MTVLSRMWRLYEGWHIVRPARSLGVRLLGSAYPARILGEKRLPHIISASLSVSRQSNRPEVCGVPVGTPLFLWLVLSLTLFALYPLEGVRVMQNPAWIDILGAPFDPPQRRQCALNPPDFE